MSQISVEKSINCMNKQTKINLQERIVCNSLGAICVLPASIVMWVGNFSDFARSCQSK